ncbi:MAG: Glycosyl transferases group 1 [Candidatus Argoarchaeum ethanivorans]|uniref:Glycosyl transferases group 1 n=1 Tax=Candidatus Argoarchaeum ethanivorans TaxID=2608793 RepID=A0A811T9G9_9EURY|nr:MAG: Glycosyl transferases group 1 [Candidatus Argoarchaeum ethanivorans]
MMNKQTNSGEGVKICFITLGAYPLLAGKNADNIIGPDVHQVILAKELIKHDFKVSIIVHDEVGVPVEYIDGMEVIKIHEDVCRLRLLNIVSKVFRIWNAMRKANAQIYFQHGATGIVALFCRLMNKKCVYHIGSDAAVNRGLITRKIKEFNQSKFSLGTFGNWLEIKMDDVIIVQNEYQRETLKEKYGKDGVLIKKPFPLTKRGMPEKTKPPIVLWVGAMAEVKQPELFVRLAEAIPDARFQMIGGHSGNPELYGKIKESSNRISNFEHLGVIPFDEINEYFSRASILVNTSMFEAYPPYAAMQAWMSYTPVVSLGDNSDEVMRRYNMGFHSKTFDQLVEDVKTLLKDEALMEEMGVNGRKYVESEHDLTHIVGEYIELFYRIGEFR